MSNEETFRPERKPIQPEDISNKSKDLDAMKNLRDQIEEGKNDSVNLSSEQPATSNANPLQKGSNLPPQLQQILAKQQNSSNGGTNEGPRLKGSEKLEELLKRLTEGDSIHQIEIVLPSKGLFYNGQDGPEDGKITIRPMTGNEEGILATPKFVRDGTAIDRIFKRCLSGNWDTKNFLTVDRTYLLIHLRGLSYGNVYEVEVKCPYTERLFNTEIDLNELSFEYCEDNLTKDTLQGTLPNSKFNYKYRLSTGADEQLIQKYRDRRIKEFDTSDQTDDTILYRTATLITDIEGLTNTHEIFELLKRLPIADVNELRNVVNNPPFGVDTKIEILSPFTQQEFSLELPIEANFFFPKMKKRDTTQV